MSTRNGTDVDAASAMKTFSDLGYKIRVANDLTVEEMKKLMLNGNRFLFFQGLHSHIYISMAEWVTTVYDGDFIRISWI